MKALRKKFVLLVLSVHLKFLPCMYSAMMSDAEVLNAKNGNFWDFWFGFLRKICFFKNSLILY